MVNYVVVTGAGGAFWGAEGDYMLGGKRAWGRRQSWKGIAWNKDSQWGEGRKKTPGLSQKAKWHKQGEPLALKMASKGW